MGLIPSSFVLTVIGELASPGPSSVMADTVTVYLEYFFKLSSFAVVALKSKSLELPRSESCLYITRYPKIVLSVPVAETGSQTTVKHEEHELKILTLSGADEPVD